MAKRYSTCALVCAVCDIRGFSLLTSRVHEFVNRVFPRSEYATRSYKLKRAYQDYVERTQNLAKRLLLKRLLIDDKMPANQRYALKATGDGYLVALAFNAPLLEDGQPNHEYDEEETELKVAAVKLLAGVRDLVEQAQVRGGRQFGEMTKKFIEEWGEWIGIDKQWLSDGPELRVAGALTLGTGIIYPGRQESLPSEIRAELESGVRRLRERLSELGVGDSAEDVVADLETCLRRIEGTEPSVSYGDAFGESVNLAFRLCAEAGRTVIGSEVKRATPYILMDRRLAGLVNQSLKELEPEEREGVLGAAWELRPFGRTVNLKGIEESWCYALVQGSPAERIAFVSDSEIFG